MLEATVDETAGMGVDVHMLQPAHTWVPWWPSKVYPMEEHSRWWKKHYILANISLSRKHLGGNMPLRFDTAGQSRTIHMDLAPTKGGKTRINFIDLAIE